MVERRVRWRRCRQPSPALDSHRFGCPHPHRRGRSLLFCRNPQAGVQRSGATCGGRTCWACSTELELPAHHQPQGARPCERVRGRAELVRAGAGAGRPGRAGPGGERQRSARVRRLPQAAQRTPGGFRRHPGAGHEGYSESVEARAASAASCAGKVSGLQAGVQGRPTWPASRQALEQRLDGLLSTVIEHQRQREGAREEVARRLQALAQKVSEMEGEAQGFREHIEEQRRRRSPTRSPAWPTVPAGANAWAGGGSLEALWR